MAENKHDGTNLEHLIFEQFRQLREHHDTRFNELNSKLNDLMAEVHETTVRLGSLEGNYILD